ncbi:Hpt domain-containing protein [candidate division KSB1 bacterium]|nr:Hpt domain-containing protein [candidate division KSB1 bacterium]
MNNCSPTIEQLRASYLKRLPDRVAALHRALEQRDFNQIQRIAHQLRGSGLSYGFARISESATAIESACLEGQVTIIRACITEFDGQVRDLLASLAGVE